MDQHKLLIANRGEIAVRIIRTAQRLGLATIAIYTPSDALAPHVSMATESVELPVRPGESEAGPYLDVERIVALARSRHATLVHPGYGFLSENAGFARAVRDAGIGFLGPSTEVITAMGLKHEARDIAVKAGVPVIPGELVDNVEQAVSVARKLQYPILIKASAGGGGMGMVACSTENELVTSFDAARSRAKSLFNNDAVLLERYYPAAHHIEIQVFGNGQGKVIHMGERECSLQRRHQKVVEETPSPYLKDKLALRDEICAAAVRLCESMKYDSAGTVEFLVDDISAAYFFLEMNTRIQVEHGVTEAAQGSLDMVELMIQQGVAEARQSFLSEDILNQDLYADVPEVHAIEVRIYAENPADNFRPSPGILQHVDWSHGQRVPEWMRIDTWISTGTTVTPFFDPLLAKIVVTALSRAEALQRLSDSLRAIRVLGPTTNIPYLLSLLASEAVQAGRTTTQYLSSFPYVPRALTVLHPGLSSLVQDLPGRATMLRGIPPSGAMDPRAHSVANLLAGNVIETEALEVISVRGAAVRLKFWSRTIVGVAGGHSGMRVYIDDRPVSSMWSRVCVEEGSVFQLVEEESRDSGGFRAYISVQGGFPDIPEYLGSKSTSMGFGGYQGRALAVGDQLSLAETIHDMACPFTLPASLIPTYPKHWSLRVVCGPHADTEFLTSEGVDKFYSMTWTVSSSSNRMGIRLSPASGQGDPNERAFLWARENGGDGGSHPSNILDNAYARGSINVNGDTPVILGCEGPDMGGYVCLCAVTQGDMWKLGQLHPGCTVSFEPVSWEAAQGIRRDGDLWLEAVKDAIHGLSRSLPEPLGALTSPESLDPRLHTIEGNGERPRVVFRQAGDSAILVEYGAMELDLTLRARIHAFEGAARKMSNKGIVGFAPCIRSTMCYYDPSLISQQDILSMLIDAERSLPASTSDMVFPGRRITHPIVLDDRWNHEALARYMQSTRDKAVYLPSNVEYLANNNGLESKQDALAKLVQSDWLVFGVGFYLACPFLVPIDPRARLVGQKMNPSRTFTPRGAIGIAGVVAAIYPIESPGGYQLYGRTIPGWHTWGKGKNFTPEQPWLLNPFDQVRYEVISEDEYEQLETDFDAGRYEFKIEACEFSISQYLAFVESIKDEVHLFRGRQAKAVAREEARENEMLREWEDAQRAARAGGDDGDTTEAGDAQATVTAPLSASIWKIKCSIGDVVKTADDVLIILEAMKTEINITAGPEHVGKTVSGYGRGVREGSVVNIGDTLINLL